MDFRPLAEAERRQLLTALRGNADRGRRTAYSIVAIPASRERPRTCPTSR